MKYPEIIQIIPAPSDLYATYKIKDGSTLKQRIACIALYKSRENIICVGGIVDVGGYLDVCEEIDNFHEYKFFTETND